MRIPKRYGASKTSACPFCERTATHKNSQGLDVCHVHIGNNLEEIRCLCGSWLELKVGKFGPYFSCPKCGNLNLKRALEIKALDKTEKPKITETLSPLKTSSPKELTITTNDVEYFD